MNLIAAGLVLVGVVCVLNAMLTMALARRVREQGDELARRRMTIVSTLPDGTSAPNFTATTIAGQTRGRADLLGAPSLIGFFASACGSCRIQLPAFAEYARSLGLERRRTLAIISGSQAADLIELLDGVSDVVIEPNQGPIATAFEVRGFPTFYYLDEDARVQSSGATVAILDRHRAS